jgi:hypothetical protein
MCISNCDFLAGPTNAAPAAAIRWEGGGGMKIVNTKVNSIGGRETWQWVVGIDVDAQNGTGATFIGNCSIENWSDTGIRVRAKQGDPHTNLVIHDNEIAGYYAPCKYGIYVGPSDTPDPANQIINRALVSDNVIWVPATATNAMYFDGCRNITVQGNSLDNSGSANAYIRVGSAVKNLALGKNNFEPGTPGTMTKIVQFDQPMGVGGQVSNALDWALPNITDVGTFHDIWRLEIADGSTMRLDFTASVFITGINNTTTVTCTRVLKRQGSAINMTTVGSDVVYGPPVNLNFDLTVTGQVGIQLAVDASDSGANGTSGNSTLAWSGGHPASISAKN